MTRRLRIARRPFVAIGIVLAPLVLLGVANLIRHGVRSDLVLATIVPFGLYAVIMLTICSTRVSVVNDGIDVSAYFLFNRFVPFEAIDHSDVQILAERDHPAFVTVHYRDRDGERKVRLSLKPYDRDDVTWFCALPGIKARTHPGLTRLG
jgi:hypothetical protein